MAHFIRPGRSVPGILLTVLTLLGAGFLLYSLASTEMIPLRFLVPAAIGSAAAAVLTFFLTRSPAKKIRFILGILWTVLFLAAAFPAGYLVQDAHKAIRTVTSPKEEVSNLSFYVKTGDAAWSLADAASYTFGILKVQDRDSTDAALSRTADEHGISLATAEYDGIAQLADALRSGEVGGILLNQAYLGLYEELAGYEEFPGEIRALATESLSHNVGSDASVSETSPESEDPAEASEDTMDVITLYISGSDTRESTLPERTRSDVNIIASINPETHKILLLSTPRDYYVPLSISGGVPDKLTHAGIYGVDVSMDTLEMLYGIDIPYYFRVNFTGFVDIIDALGGIEVQSDYTFDAGGYHFAQGANQLGGDAALAFCRERYSFAEGDRQRGKNQMAVIRAAIQKAASPAILSEYSSILDSVQNNMETNVPYPLIAGLIREQLENGASWSITTYSVDGTGDTQVPYSMSSSVYVMVPDTATVDHAKELLAEVASAS